MQVKAGKHEPPVTAEHSPQETPVLEESADATQAAKSAGTLSLQEGPELDEAADTYETAMSPEDDETEDTNTSGSARPAGSMTLLESPKQSEADPEEAVSSSSSQHHALCNL